MDGLPQRLAHARKCAGITQHSLASMTDIREGTISRYERGELVPSVEALAKLAEKLGVSMDWIATGEGAGPASTTSEAAA